MKITLINHYINLLKEKGNNISQSIPRKLRTVVVMMLKPYPILAITHLCDSLYFCFTSLCMYLAPFCKSLFQKAKFTLILLRKFYKHSRLNCVPRVCLYNDLDLGKVWIHILAPYFYSLKAFDLNLHFEKFYDVASHNHIVLNLIDVILCGPIRSIIRLHMITCSVHVSLDAYHYYIHASNKLACLLHTDMF